MLCEHCSYAIFMKGFVPVNQWWWNWAYKNKSLQFTGISFCVAFLGEKGKESEKKIVSRTYFNEIWDVFWPLVIPSNGVMGEKKTNNQQPWLWI